MGGGERAREKREDEGWAYFTFSTGFFLDTQKKRKNRKIASND